MQAILKLDVAGQPRGWLSLQEAISAYPHNPRSIAVADPLPTALGDTQLLPRENSPPTPQPSLARTGRVLDECTPPLSNRTLVRRDDHRCLYCGHQFARHELTRDHVVPTSRGGRNNWENVVAACKRCNWLKDCRTPEEAKMPLLAVPFRPNAYEWHFLAKERVLADQMEYLSTQFRADRHWAH